jgi:hypothetical protein
MKHERKKKILLKFLRKMKNANVGKNKEKRSKIAKILISFTSINNFSATREFAHEKQYGFNLSKYFFSLFPH